MTGLKPLLGMLALVSVLSGGLTGCSKDDKPKPTKGRNGDISEQEKLQPGIQVVSEDGTPLKSAQILIGRTQNAPFEGNYGQTDDQGNFPLPAAWKQPDMVTIDAAGYLRATYMEQAPQPRKFVLKKKFQAQSELKGVTTGHPIQNKDGYIDFSLVISAMTRQDLLNFQVHKVMSSVSDTLSALGMKMSVPSNVSIPRQTENYFIGITLDKPSYRLQFPELGVQRVFAARGRFPFKPVVDGLRNDTELFQMINYFTITGGSFRDVEITKRQTQLNIPVMDLTFKTKKSFKAPVLEKGQALIAVAVADSNGYLIPTDFKKLSSSQQTQLAIWEENPSYVAQVIKNQNEFDSEKSGLDRLSASFLPFDEGQQSSFLPLIKNPEVKSKLDYIIPEVSADLHQMMTYAVISDVKISKGPDGETIKTPNQVWEVYAPAWVTEMALPQWEWTKTAPTTRFEVSLVGSTTLVEMPIGPAMMEKATHVTRSSLDYQ